MQSCYAAAAKEAESCPKHNFLPVMSGLTVEGLLKKICCCICVDCRKKKRETFAWIFVVATPVLVSEKSNKIGKVQ